MTNTCLINTCTNAQHARALCYAHYAAWRSHDPLVRSEAEKAKAARQCQNCRGPIPSTRRLNVMFCGPECKRQAQYLRTQAAPPKRNPPCSVDGCETPILAKKLCSKHYNRMRSKGSLDDTRANARGECSETACHAVASARGLCDKHYNRVLAVEKRAALRESLDARSCAFCEGPLIGRNQAAEFCSRTCKARSRVASGRAARDSAKHYFASRYGLTLEQVAEMSSSGCAICGTTNWPGRHSRPHVDHDHAHGHVRGILCSECNTGLGKFKDNPELLKAAIEYLVRTQRPKEVW